MVEALPYARYFDQARNGVPLHGYAYRGDDMTDEEPKRTLVISTIENGTVIDHITAGEALTVLRILGITGTTHECVSVATNVATLALVRKDVVKIENRELKAKEVDRIALVAPHAP
jgi:aspartate carbamoyltransferase regulatory subunit